MRKWDSFLMHYYNTLEVPATLPHGISWLWPQQQPQVQTTMRRFFRKFFHDTRSRTLMLGINPGRHGAGITGVNFTAGRQLTDPCGIAHPFGNQSELSAAFIYEMIAAYGGPEQFYNDVFIGSVCPLGFVQGGKNLNYYDDKILLEQVTPFIVASVGSLAAFRVKHHRCICIGGEKNYRHLSRWNEQHGWFETIVPVPHPRFIQQYKRRQKHLFIDQYLAALTG